MSTSTPTNFVRRTSRQFVGGLRDDGVAGILATVITAEWTRCVGGWRIFVRVRDADPAIADMIWGIHIEGPFLNEHPGTSARIRRHTPGRPMSTR